MQVSQPTISDQLKKLETSLGTQLFRKAGRRLELTEVGRRVFRYADEIFTIGENLLAAIHDETSPGPRRLVLGMTPVVSRLWIQRLLMPLIHLDQHVPLTCESAPGSHLVGELANERIDGVLSDQPLSHPPAVKLRSQVLARCGISFLAEGAMAQRYRSGFPKSLHDAPLLLPTRHSQMRCALDTWCQSRQCRPRIVAEIDDPALLAGFAQSGLGLIAVPQIVANDVMRLYNLELVGRTDEVVEQVLLIRLDQEPEHPMLRVVLDSAAQETVETSRSRG